MRWEIRKLCIHRDDLTCVCAINARVVYPWMEISEEEIKSYIRLRTCRYICVVTGVKRLNVSGPFTH